MLIKIKKGAPRGAPFQSDICLSLGFFCLGFWFFLFKAIFVFAHKCAELGIVILLAVQRVVKRAFRIFIRHLYKFSLEFSTFILSQVRYALAVRRPYDKWGQGPGRAPCNHVCDRRFA